jgi:ribose-phosphate pyrophosphokinase
MRRPVVLALPGNARLAAALGRRLRTTPRMGGTRGERPAGGLIGATIGAMTLRRFPDGETYVRLRTPVRGREVVVVCSLERPDERALPALLVAATARDLGARRVGLVAPYLGYMRQDARFAAGEGVTSRYFGRLLSAAFDWLVTVDPHLHRHHSLDAVYAIPALTLSAAPRIAAWITCHVRRPVVIGPDAESAQWAEAVAAACRLPCVVLEKVRRGDRKVAISVPDLRRWRDHTPVLVDDIISTAGTMIATVRQLRRARLAPPICIGVHAVFADGAYDELRGAGVARIVTCNTIAHPSNAIDVTDVVAAGVARALGARGAAHRAQPRH